LLVGDDIPTEQDIITYIVPHCAAKWRELGVLLGLPSSTLDIVEADHPHSCEQRCKAVLLRWLKRDAHPTWGKLVGAAAVNALCVSSVTASVHANTEGM